MVFDLEPGVDINRKFACVAEGVAYLFRKGFETKDYDNAEGRLMVHPDGTQVVVQHVGFLSVSLRFA